MIGSRYSIPRSASGKGSRMETEGLSESQKKKIVSLRKRWKATADEAKGENLKIGARKKEARDALLEEAEKLMPRKAFKLAMKRCDHQDNADGVRDEIEDETILDAFDKVALSLGLPGFEDAAGEAEAKQAKKARAKAENVTELDEHREQASA